MSIELESLRFQSKGEFSLECSDISIDPGTYVVVVGRNGSGKTSFVESVLGVKPGAKCIGKIDGRDLRVMHNDKSLLRRLGFQMQGMSFPFGVRVGEIVQLHKMLYLNDNRELAEGLELKAIEKKKYWFCSLGERARTELYFACAHNPEYLLFDEPLRGLDASASDYFLNWFADYRAARPETICVSTTHSPEELEQANNIIWLDRGRVKYSGGVDAFREHYLGAYRLDITTSDEQDVPDLGGRDIAFCGAEGGNSKFTVFGDESLKGLAAGLLTGSDKVYSASVKRVDSRDLLDYISRV